MGMEKATKVVRERIRRREMKREEGRRKTASVRQVDPGLSLLRERFSHTVDPACVCVRERDMDNECQPSQFMFDASVRLASVHTAKVSYITPSDVPFIGSCAAGFRLSTPIERFLTTQT